MDYLFRGLGYNNKIRVFAVDASESVANIVKVHDCELFTGLAFSRVLLAAALMGVMEKDGNGVTIRIDSDGPIKSLFAQATINGKLRGYVSNPYADSSIEGELSIEKVVGSNGVLSVIKTNSEGKDFIGDVILTASNITKDIAYYFYASEQVPTVINLSVRINEEGSVEVARGYLLQLLPGYSNEDLDYLEKLNKESVDDLKGAINKMFPDFINNGTISISDYCDCSKERFAIKIEALDLNALEDLANEDLEIVCNFCETKYVITKKEVQEIIERKKEKLV